MFIPESPLGTRRSFLARAGLAAGGLAALGGHRESAAQDCAVQPPPGMGTQQRAPTYLFPRLAPTRVRKSLREVVETPADLERLTRAYAALKQ